MVSTAPKAETEDYGIDRRRNEGGALHWLKLRISLDLNVVNIWDNVSTQANKMYDTSG